MFNKMINCKICRETLPDLLLDPAAPANAAARAHIATCAACARELASFEATMSLLDTWQPPEISPYFDQKLAVRLREQQAAPAANWFERLRARLLLNTGRQFRPALAGAMALMLIVGGGSFGIATYPHGPRVVQTSAAVNDLQILNKNEQALQQMDQLMQDAARDNDSTVDATPQS
jgi:anti-sigma factor RsiW